MATYEEYPKAMKPNITSQLEAAEREIKRQGGLIADLQDQVKSLYSAIGIPIPPSPDREATERPAIYRG